MLMLISLWGCAPLPEGGLPTGTPSVQVSATAAPSPIASGSPLAVASPVFLKPDLPADTFKALQALEVLEPKMKETETWYANSGIMDNRLGYYVSKQAPIEIEAQLIDDFTQGGNEPYIEGVGPVFTFEGTRVCVMRRKDSTISQLFVIAPLSDPPKVPESLRALRLPPIPAESLRGQKALVVLATGEGLGEHVDHMLGQAGLVITPSPSETPTATASPPS